MPRGDRPRRDLGFTYLGLLALVVLIGLMLSAAGEVVATASRREREAHLIWVGHQYRAAIGRYWAARRAYPQSLQELLGTLGDAPVKVRYLRFLYPDPMAHGADWVLVEAPGGGIKGVASSSKKAPFKTANFEEADWNFAEAASYADWQFVYPPPPKPKKPEGAPAPLTAPR